MRFSVAGLAIAVVCGGCGAVQRENVVADKARALICDRTFAHDAAVALAGGEVGKPVAKEIAGLESCHWHIEGRDGWIQVVDLPAGDWVKVLPDMMEGVRGSGLKAAGLDKLDEAESIIAEGGRVDDGAACELFTKLVVELSGYPAGSTEAIAYVPNDQAPQAINAQSCVDGRFRSVQLVDSAIEVGTSAEIQIREALAAVGDAS